MGRTKDIKPEKNSIQYLRHQIQKEKKLVEQQEKVITSLRQKVENLQKEINRVKNMPEVVEKPKVSTPKCPKCGGDIKELPMANGKKFKICYACKTRGLK